MAVVQQVVDAWMGSGVAHVELVAAHGVALHADGENLALHAVDDVGELFGKDLIQAVLEPQAGPQPVGGNILIAVGNPDVVEHHVIQLFADALGNPAAGDAVVNPEFAYFFICA